VGFAPIERERCLRCMECVWQPYGTDMAPKTVRMESLTPACRTVAAGLLRHGADLGRCEPVSSRREGSRSIWLTISRAGTGAGKRRTTTPSLSISTMPKPRGRSSLRSGPSSSGELSVITTTSRSVRSSGRSFSIRSCCWNRGSSGVSAKTTSGRATQRSSSRVGCSDALSACTAAAGVCATVTVAASATSVRARHESFILPPTLPRDNRFGAGCERKTPAGGWR
jgi:hypothetical protein